MHQPCLSGVGLSESIACYSTCLPWPSPLTEWRLQMLATLGPYCSLESML